MGNNKVRLDFPSEESSSDEDKKDANPEWKLLEEQAENVNDGNDEEEDNPVTKNTIKYQEIYQLRFLFPFFFCNNFTSNTFYILLYNLSGRYKGYVFSCK